MQIDSETRTREMIRTCSQWMPDCPIDYKPISYSRSVDEAFLLFSSDLHQFFKLYYFFQITRKFPVELEENNSLSFFDIKLFRDSEKISDISL